MSSKMILPFVLIKETIDNQWGIDRELSPRPTDPLYKGAIRTLEKCFLIRLHGAPNEDLFLSFSDRFIKLT